MWDERTEWLKRKNGREPRRIQSYDGDDDVRVRILVWRLRIKFQFTLIADRVRGETRGFEERYASDETPFSNRSKISDGRALNVRF